MAEQLRTAACSEASTARFRKLFLMDLTKKSIIGSRALSTSVCKRANYDQRGLKERDINVATSEFSRIGG
jgi:hypothetical protein